MQRASPIKTMPKKQRSSGLVNSQNQNIFFQPKLTISQPNDIYEQEADLMANKVMRMRTNENKFFKPTQNTIQRKCAHCEEEKQIQRSGESNNANITPSPGVHETINSRGHPLDAGTKNFMESRFGYDFNNVQIHNDSLAHQSSKDINAKAYTSGNHIAFATGQYKPDTFEGRHLLAHELTHLVQQAGYDTIQRKTYLEQEEISDAQIVDPEVRTKEVLINVFANSKSRLYKYYDKNLSKAFSVSIDEVSTFAYKYRQYLKRRKVSFDPSVKDKDLVADVAGFADPGLHNLFLKTTSNYCHAIHEYVHLLSNPDFLITWLGTNLMEGLTQYFTDVIIKEQLGTECTTHKYQTQLTCAKSFINDMGGEDVVAKFFFLTDAKFLEKIISVLNGKSQYKLKLKNVGDLMHLKQLCDYF
jgi:hypothetical protein